MTVASTQFIETPDRTTHKRAGVSVRDRAHKTLSICQRPGWLLRNLVRTAGDPLRPNCSVIEVHVGELRQLSDAVDPSPFHDKDLDPKAEEFIVGTAPFLRLRTPD